MVNCENCQKKLTKEDISAGTCLNLDCGFPITDEIQDSFLKEIGLESKPPEEAKQPVILSMQSFECINCGYILSETEHKQGFCPECGENPDDENANPPVVNITPSNTADIESSKEINEDADSYVTEDSLPSIDSSQNEDANFEVVIGTAKGTEFILKQNVELGRDELINSLNQNFSGNEVISSKHIKLSYFNNKLFIKDLGSTNGTQINNERLIANVDHELKINDRIIIGEGGFIFRLIKYSQMQTGQMLNKFQLKDENTGVVFPLDTGLTEVIGRDPLNKGSYHPFLYDVFSHRIQQGENTDSIKKELQAISRNQFSVRFDNASKSWELTNLSVHGTTVNNQKLSNSGEKLIAKPDITIEFGIKFKCILQTNPKLPFF